ncbi:unnamed protein product [Cuscuta epithymum]|uniref:Uncharacterized protein n=1 Tax=Cuscuta epithymum TaxID=186058 RepID=A0AAV0FXH4_9ASTE|nr:unnamed protein product [Cuscuta epithymum]
MSSVHGGASLLPLGPHYSFWAVDWEIVCSCSLLSGLGAPMFSSGVEDEVGDIENDAPSVKRLRMSSSDALQDMFNGEELSLYGTSPNNAHSAQRTFSFAVRDSLINIGPLKDFSYGLRINADPNATGVAKQSNYELVCCSGHGKNGALCVLQRSIRPEVITQVCF